MEANSGSYIVYIALIAMYLVLIIFFFPETRHVVIFHFYSDFSDFLNPGT
jgi:hypothetical protein